MTPASRSDTPPGPASRTPNPVSTSPGSIPMTRKPGAALGGRDGVDDLVGDVVVGVNGLNVVLLLQGLHQSQDSVSVLALRADRGERHHAHFGFQDGDLPLLQGPAHRLHFIRSGGEGGVGRVVAWVGGRATAGAPPPPGAPPAPFGGALLVGLAGQLPGALL